MITIAESRWRVCRHSLYSSFHFSVCLKMFIRDMVGEVPMVWAHQKVVAGQIIPA